jgi:exoribonuclease R
VPARRIRVLPSAAQLTPILDAVRAELQVPEALPADVLAETDAAIDRGPVIPPGAATTVEDRTDLALVTIDPAGSRDLDQAYFGERRGAGFRIHYAIADVAAFVPAGSATDREAWARGLTRYQPDRRTPLYPEQLGQGAASLLPDDTRHALLWTIDLDADGRPSGDPRFRRATVRSRHQFTYPEAQQRIDDGAAEDSLLVLRDVGRLRLEQERERGGVSLRLPTQEVVLDDGHVDLEFRAPLPVEDWNAQISLLTGIVAADVMLRGRVGILRTLPPPEPGALDDLRHAASAFGVAWPATVSYADFVRGLDPATTIGAVLLHRAARTLRGAGYTSFDGELPPDPGHSAVASTYAHVTAPLRRLADRFANEVALALVGGTEVPGWAREALPLLPDAMAAAGRHERDLERAIVDTVEALILRPHVGETFDGTVLSVEKGRSTVQLADPAVTADLDGVDLSPGTALTVRLVDADPAARRVRFAPV